jgi:thiol-disulfide isomerase/thioredoxin
VDIVKLFPKLVANFKSGKVFAYYLNKQVRMKKILAAFIFVTASVALSAQELPNTQVKDVNTGRKVAFNETVEKGKVTVISFWATWCVPCKKEIKNITLKLPEWKKQADFNYITMSIDEARAEGLVRTYALSQGWNFPFYIDPNSDLKRSLNFQSVPYTLIIDKHGKIAFKHIGYEEGGEAEVFAKVKELAAAQ